MRRVLPLFILALAELVVVAVVLGVPNLGAAGGFLSGGYTTGTTVVAASTALLWLALLAATVFLGIRLVRHVAVNARWRRLLAGLAVVASLALLSLGVLRHVTSSYSMCCGSISQAQQQLTTAP